MQVDGFSVFHRLQIKKIIFADFYFLLTISKYRPISQSLTHVNTLLIQNICNMSALSISAQYAILLLKCGDFPQHSVSQKIKKCNSF